MKYRLVIHGLTKYQADTLKDGIKLDKERFPVTVEEE
jgi:hypothetical protein